jgi:hypothetical protein
VSNAFIEVGHIPRHLTISPVPPGWQSHHHSLARVHVVPAWQLVPLQALSAHSRPAAPQPGRPFTTVVLRPPHCWRVTRMVEPAQQWKQQKHIHRLNPNNSLGDIESKPTVSWHRLKAGMQVRAKSRVDGCLHCEIASDWQYRPCLQCV